MDHDARVEEAEVRRAFAGQRGHGGQHHFTHDALVHLGRDDRCGRIGTHAAGVRAFVGVAQALVVLRGGERQHGLAVHHCDEAGFLAFEEFLDHDQVAGLAEAAGEHVQCRLHGFVDGRADHDALAGGEAVGLDDQRRLLCANPRRVEVVARELGVRRGGNAVALEEILGEGLRAFEPRSEFARPEAAQSRGRERVAEADDERRFGTDDGEADLFALGESEQGRHVVRGDVDVGRVRLEPRARVARRDEDLRHARRLRNFPGQRVFATAGTDDQHFHEGIGDRG